MNGLSLWQVHCLTALLRCGPKGIDLGEAGQWACVPEGHTLSQSPWGEQLCSSPSPWHNALHHHDNTPTDWNLWNHKPNSMFPFVFSGIFYSDEKLSNIKDFYISISNYLIPVYINLVIKNSWEFVVSLVDSIKRITSKIMLSANKNYFLPFSPSSQPQLTWLESVMC